MAKKKNLEDEVEEVLQNEHESKFKPEIYTENDLISSGCTLLNLALSNYPNGGYRKGTMCNLIGGSSSGKSLMALTMMAEAAHNGKLDHYKLIYDETESAMFFDLSSFGSKIYDRLEFKPRSYTIQDWAGNLGSLLGVGVAKKKKGKKKQEESEDDITKDLQPIIHVTDSFDALTTLDDITNDKPDKKGGYRTEKPIVTSITFPKICRKMENTQSFLLIISQTRSSLAMFGDPETRSGANALNFYEVHEIWLKKVTAIKREARGIESKIGRVVSADLRKNKLTGKRRKINLYIYDEIGIDDIRTSCEWMLDYGFWGEEKKKSEDTGEKGNIVVTDGDFIEAKMETLVKYIEDNDLEPKLNELLTERWGIVESELTVERKKRYS